MNQAVLADKFQTHSSDSILHVMKSQAIFNSLNKLALGALGLLLP